MQESADMTSLTLTSRVPDSILINTTSFQSPSLSRIPMNCLA